MIQIRQMRCVIWTGSCKLHQCRPFKVAFICSNKCKTSAKQTMFCTPVLQWLRSAFCNNAVLCGDVVWKDVLYGTVWILDLAYLKILAGKGQHEQSGCHVIFFCCEKCQHLCVQSHHTIYQCHIPPQSRRVWFYTDADIPCNTMLFYMMLSYLLCHMKVRALSKNWKLLSKKVNYMNTAYWWRIRLKPEKYNVRSRDNVIVMYDKIEGAEGRR